MTDADGESKGLLGCVDEASQQCDVCRPSDKAPHLPIAGASSASSVDDELPADLPFLGDAIAFHAMDAYEKYSR